MVKYPVENKPLEPQFLSLHIRKHYAPFEKAARRVDVGILSILVDGHPFGLRAYAAEACTGSPFLKTHPSRTSSRCCQRVIFREALRASDRKTYRRG